MSAKLVYHMPAEQYHATVALSKSGLDQFQRSPAHYKAWLEGAKEEPTPAMVFGSAFHCAVLERDEYAKRYVIFEGDRRTKAGKEAYESLQTSGATIITLSLIHI